MLNILHLNSYYIDNHLYKKLYEFLDNDYKQSIYIPIKQDRREENKTELVNGKLYYAKIIKRKHTVFYEKKIQSLFNDIIAKQLHVDTDLIHAHNLFVDGGVAYHLKKKFGIRYIVSIRMTDIALQYKYMLHRRKFSRKILNEADQIIFISPLYKDRLLAYMNSDFRIELEKKISIVPNGIDNHWLDSYTSNRQIDAGMSLKLLYIGQIIKRKNILLLIEAVNLLNKKGINAELTIIGGRHPNENDYFEKMQTAVDSSNKTEYRGKITDPSELRKAMASHHIFVMPSKNELFGLVYIEALSQNLPVIYAQNEGISPYLKDGYFGAEVNPDNIESIAEGIINVQKNYSNLSDMHLFAKQFNWSEIANQYKLLYRTIHE